MSIEQIHTLDDNQIPVVPALEDYDDVSEGWNETEFRAFELAGGHFGGYWRGAPGEVYFRSWPYDEVCVITRGRVAIEDNQGRRREFSAARPSTFRQASKVAGSHWRRPRSTLLPLQP